MSSFDRHLITQYPFNQYIRGSGHLAMASNIRTSLACVHIVMMAGLLGVASLFVPAMSTSYVFFMFWFCAKLGAASESIGDDEDDVTWRTLINMALWAVGGYLAVGFKAALGVNADLAISCAVVLVLLALMVELVPLVIRTNGQVGVAAPFVNTAFFILASICVANVDASGFFSWLFIILNAILFAAFLVDVGGGRKSFDKETTDRFNFYVQHLNITEDQDADQLQ